MYAIQTMQLSLLENMVLNVPHTPLEDVKGYHNWMKVTSEILTFPGGGTQFIHGALHYIDFHLEVNTACENLS